MAKVPYVINRNTATGTPSLYCRVQHHQNATFGDLCRRTGQRLGMSPHAVRAVVQDTLEEAYRLTQRGLRVEIGDHFLSLYPQVSKSVRADIDQQTGEILWPDEEAVVPKGADGRLECEVHKKLNRRFRSEVHWERAKYRYR